MKNLLLQAALPMHFNEQYDIAKHEAYPSFSHIQALHTRAPVLLVPAARIPIFI